MVKGILATVGLLAIIGGVVVWQYNFFSSQTNKIKTDIDRATAVSRAERMISETKAKASGLDEQARKYQIDARTLELAVEREEKNLSVTREAMKSLAQTAKKAGLPKASEQDKMTSEQKKLTLSLGGKSISATDVYPTLARWQAELKHKETISGQKRKMVERMRAVAGQLLEKKTEMDSVINKLEGQLKELEMSRELAKVNMELSKMEANVEGIYSGDYGKVLDTIQQEIDELSATSEVYKDETVQKKEVLNPSDIVTPAVRSDSSVLDDLWK